MCSCLVYLMCRTVLRKRSRASPCKAVSIATQCNCAVLLLMIFFFFFFLFRLRLTGASSHLLLILHTPRNVPIISCNCVIKIYTTCVSFSLFAAIKKLMTSQVKVKDFHTEAATLNCRLETESIFPIERLSESKAGGSERCNDARAI